ncbi:ATP-binding cassette domain-containing protein [Nonomuraea sp. NPDC059007]|uniref:ATP-binding cassette domain-containing protein n=1 Tax=Nonomuraea sp. NPDC059007 TaxID=3346692 RepID=UPI0036AA0DCA
MNDVTRAQAAIKADDLHKRYGDVLALDGLSLEVPAGTLFGLVGPNGAGKSSTVNILTTLSRPDRGSASVAGIDVLRRPDQVRRAIGCVTQKVSVDPQATGRENLRLHGGLYGMPRRDAAARANALLERFGLAEAADRVTRTYSGGMQRKLDVAMGLMHRPQVLFLDEPTTGLDPQARAELWKEISRLAAEEGMSILLTTHYLEEADKLAASLAIVDRGRVIAQGSPDKLKSELNGDAVQVELTDPSLAAQAAEAVRRVEGTSEITPVGRSLRARVEDGAAAVPRILAALEAERLEALSVTISRPSLDDVYLKHTGRMFAQAEEEGTS